QQHRCACDHRLTGGSSAHRCARGLPAIFTRGVNPGFRGVYRRDTYRSRSRPEITSMRLIALPFALMQAMACTSARTRPLSSARARRPLSDVYKESLPLFAMLKPEVAAIVREQSSAVEQLNSRNGIPSLASSTPAMRAE